MIKYKLRARGEQDSKNIEYLLSLLGYKAVQYSLCHLDIQAYFVSTTGEIFTVDKVSKQDYVRVACEELSTDQLQEMVRKHQNKFTNDENVFEVINSKQYDNFNQLENWKTLRSRYNSEGEFKRRNVIVGEFNESSCEKIVKWLETLGFVVSYSFNHQEAIRFYSDDKSRPNHLGLVYTHGSGNLFAHDILQFFPIVE